MTTISILGLGWLGFPLGKQLVQKGYTVLGTTTTPEKLEAIREAGIEGHLFSFTEQDIDSLPSSFWDSEILIITLPPHSFPNREETIEMICWIAGEFKIKRIIFISSISVYPEMNRVVVEDDAENYPSHGRWIIKLEKAFQEFWDRELQIIRFAGLFGSSRHPGRFLAGKTDLPNRNAPVNMIHLEDCISALEAAILPGKPTGVYHLASPDHPTRQEFYTLAAKLLNLQPPTFTDEATTSFKLVNPNRFEDHFGFNLKHTDLLNSLRTL